MKTKITFAQPDDVPDILKFIKDLARFEKLESELHVTEEHLRKTLFGEKKFAEVLFIEESEKRVGFALFFHNYSTFLGKPGIYLEDLYIIPEFRSRGYGKMLLTYLAQIAVERKCGRLEWSVLDWNKKAIDFYCGLGAEPMSEWTVFRIHGEKLKNLAIQNKANFKG